MFIRNIRKSDYEAIDALLLQIHQVDVLGRPDMFSPIEQYMTRVSFESLVENKNMITILAQDRRKIIGCCFVSMLEHSGMKNVKTAYIDLLVVDEKYRRQGIGRMIFHEVQKRVQKVGVSRIDLMVWSHNPIAESAYRSYGMVPQRSVYEISL